MSDVSAQKFEGDFIAGAQSAGQAEPLQWALEAVPPTPSIHSLSWKKGHADWFYRHFDHAAETIISYLLGDSPLLRGRILDVGCGDGITDLGVALRTGCKELIGVEPFKQYERLPGILGENNIPADIMPPNLRFMAEDANFLPFPDDSFDVVLSWGSMEHIAGGYLQALREVKRVLRHDGLFMAAPGLFYSNIGHHLDEFSKEPFFHLKKPLDEVKRIVLGTKPSYMDRAGEFATPEQYWQWFRELNPITVSRFEEELRALDFEPWRAALRTEELIEYTPEILDIPIQDLAIGELYLSCINRKGRT
jgi:SAM-dependent methyltransferase